MDGGNPILDELGGLSDPAKQALLTAHQTMAAPPMQVPQITPQMKQDASGNAGAPPPMLTHPGMQSGPPALPQPPQPQIHTPGLKGTTAGDTAERQRLLSTGSGASQIHNPFLRGLAETGNVIGHIAAPGLMQALPGTQEHHNLLLGQANNAVTQDIGNEQKEAQATNLNLQPQLKATQTALAQEKQNELEDFHHHTEENNQGKLNATLAQHGYAPDEENPGQLRPLKYEEMSEPQQAVYDLKGAQEEAQRATADLKRAQNDPNSSVYKLAQARLQSAQQAHSIALQRLGLSEKQFEMRAHGTENEQALPGSMITDSGQSVGTAFQQNVRPTGQERNKADMANSAAQQIGDMKAIIQKRPDIFGPAAGRTTDLKVWLGSQDPDAQRFRAARTIAGDHLAGTFGGRSEAALHALDNALGQFKDNPEAALAGLDQLAGANTSFQKAGTVRTAGSNAAEPPRPPGVPPDYKWNPQGNGGKGSWKAPQK